MIDNGDNGWIFAVKDQKYPKGKLVLKISSQNDELINEIKTLKKCAAKQYDEHIPPVITYGCVLLDNLKDKTKSTLHTYYIMPKYSVSV